MTTATPAALPPQDLASHLRPETWVAVNRAFVAKALGELAHELLLAPACEGGGWYLLETARTGTSYRFRARRLALDHWSIDAASIEKRVDGRRAPLDGTWFVVELADRLGIPAARLPDYLHEVASTLAGAAYKHQHQRWTASEVATAPFQDVEAAMTEGHPVFIANNGRIGFSAHDYRRFAPEVGAPIGLVWLAVHARLVEVSCVAGLTYVQLLSDELGPDVLADFQRSLAAQALDPAHYRLLPVHPWQWRNRVAQLFAAELARRDLVFLGVGPDRYQAQQSIRTLFNTSHPRKPYVKTALSIRNMGFSRGLAATLPRRGAAVNDWVATLVAGDPYLGWLGFRLLREVAFVGVHHPIFARAATKRVDAHKEMLGALWRESPLGRVGPGQRLMTMAALMHRDRDGVALWPALIRASGLPAGAWVRRLLRAYLTPQLHCLYVHDLVFTPHCENVILILEDHAPVGIFLKDLAEDIGVLNPRAPLPDAVRHLALRVPEDVVTLSIFTDAFDCVFRFLAAILDGGGVLPQHRFWELVAACVRDYQRARPGLADRFARHDLFAPTFIRNCLNRLQLANNEEMVDMNAPEPVDSLKFAGTLDNPIAPFRAAEAPVDHDWGDSRATD